MQTLELQKILFPSAGRCMDQFLYFRTLPKETNVPCAIIDPEEKKIVFEKNASVFCDTYFNMFSVFKWNKYTKVENVFLHLSLRGTFKVTLSHKEEIGGVIVEKIMGEKIVSSQTRSDFDFPFEDAPKTGLYLFLLEALKDDSEFFGGAFCTKISREELHSVKIGIGICTFKREKFVERNILILKNLMSQNQEIAQCLDVFVSDNGQTLETKKLEGEHIHIVQNKNVGGAGGFTRTLIEMKRSGKAITHALLMDDDILIEPEAILRTYRILTLLKDEYKEAFIGGAMLRLDMMNVQVESGARWNGGMLKSLKGGLDLRNIDCCVQNEIEETADYNAWWYCCFPFSVVRDDNLPLPIFIRGDDVEYGLRNCRNLILLNGICVWHEPFENKYSSSMEYYIMRNQLIDNAFHVPGYRRRRVKKDILAHCKREIFLYRYKNIDLYIRGIKDFLKGPAYFEHLDAENLHKEILSLGYKAVPLKDCSIPFDLNMLQKSLETFGMQRSTLKKIKFMLHQKSLSIKRFFSLNGILLKARGTNIVVASLAQPEQFYRKKRVMQYFLSGNKAFETQKSLSKTIACFCKIYALFLQLDFCLARAQKKWRIEGKKFRTLAFWETYLGI